MNPLVLVLLFLVGVFAWSFGEYTLHRFAFHEQRGSWKGSIEHLEFVAQSAGVGHGAL